MAIRVSLSSALENLSRAVGVCVAIAFALSVVHDWAYLDALGLSFVEVPTSISDHVRTGLLWLPWCGAAFGIGLIVGAMLPDDLNIGRFGAWLDRWSWALMVLAIVLLAAIGGPPVTFYFGLLALWALVAIALERSARKRELRSRRNRVRLLLLPLFLPLVAAIGATQADAALKSTFPLARFKNSAVESAPRLVRPIRHFERFVIVVNERGVIEILRSDDLVSIDRFSRPFYYEGALCRWFGVVCTH